MHLLPRTPRHARRSRACVSSAMTGCPDCTYTPAESESLPVSWRPAFYELERLRHGMLHAQARLDAAEAREKEATKAAVAAATRASAAEAVVEAARVMRHSAITNMFTAAAEFDEALAVLDGLTRPTEVADLVDGLLGDT